MARAYSYDLRERVVSAVLSGQSCRGVAERFGVSVASVVRWTQRVRAIGSAAAKPMGGYRKHVFGPERDFILSRLMETPELSVSALLCLLAQERGKRVCRDTLWRFLRREGLEQSAFK